MKRSMVALLLVATMLFSCICSVNAAMTKDEFINLCKTLATEIEVPVDIMGMKTTGTYGNKIVAKVDDGASFKASIDMAKVKAVVKSVLDEAEVALGTGSSQLAEFQALPVVGEFEITAAWTGVNAPVGIEDLIEPGFDGLGDIFEVTEVEKTSDNAVRAKIAVKSGIVVTKLADLPDEILLEIDGFTVVEDGEMNATIAGSTAIVNRITDSYDVLYKFVDAEAKTVDIKPVIIDVRTGSGSGSSSTTTFYTVTYDLGEGEVITESVVAGKTIELTKVPEKEGYAFGGWYSDAELTNKITSITVGENVTVYASWIAEGEEGSDIAHPVPDMLNGDDHFAYLVGFPDGTIRPLANISRAEVATIFFRLLKEEVREANITTTNDFVDVNDGDWCNTAISTMAKMGIVQGKGNNMFAPTDNITRAEFATICARFDEANETTESIFSDIDGHWAEEYILEATAYGWIEGYMDGTFRPDSNITRAEAATLINRVLVRLPETNEDLLDDMVTWPDNADESAWYYIAMQEATNSHTYGRIDAVNEKWNALEANRDWTVYED